MDQTARKKLCPFEDIDEKELACCLAHYHLNDKLASKTSGTKGKTFNVDNFLKTGVRYDRYLGLDGSDREPGHSYTDDDYLICISRLTCFSLIQKSWHMAVDIADLKEIEWTSDPYQSLQLPNDKKDFIRTLVDNFDQEQEESLQTDIIQGKGKGLIFLLHGAPGLGKTLTAGISGLELLMILV